MTQAVDLDHPVVGFMHRWVNELALYFAHIHVITPIAGRQRLADNITLHAYKSPHEPDVPRKRHLFFQQSLAKLVLGNRVDTMLVHMIPKWALLAAPYAKIKRVPMTLWYTHGSVNRVLRVAHALVDQVMTASQESYLLPGRHVHIMGHGIDTDWFVPSAKQAAEIENGRFHILMPGRISPTKQPHLLVEAIAQLPYSDQQAVRCSILGRPHSADDRRYQQYMAEQIKRYRLEQNIFLTGPTPYEKMVRQYQSADLVLNLSQTNSLDKTVLEAMACGVPVLSSNPACRSLLEPIDASLFFSQGDLSALASQLWHWMHRSKAERTRVGMALRQVVETEHALTRLMQKMSSLL